MGMGWDMSGGEMSRVGMSRGNTGFLVQGCVTIHRTCMEEAALTLHGGGCTDSVSLHGGVCTDSISICMEEAAPWLLPLE